MANKTLIIKMDPSATFTGGSTASSGIATYNNKIITGVGTGNTNLTLNFASSKISSRTFNKVFNIKVSKSAAQQKVDTLQAEYDAACAAITEVQNWFKTNNISTLSVIYPLDSGFWGYACLSISSYNNVISLSYNQPTNQNIITCANSYSGDSSGDAIGAKYVAYIYSNSLGYYPTSASPFTSYGDSSYAAYSFLFGYNLLNSAYVLAILIKARYYYHATASATRYDGVGSFDATKYFYTTEYYLTGFSPTTNTNVYMGGYAAQAGAEYYCNFLLNKVNKHRYPGTILTELNNAKASV